MSSTHSPIKGIALGFTAYFLFSCSDANVKALGGRLPVFEIGFFQILFAAIILLFLKPRDERWRDAARLHRPGLVALRGLAGAAAGILGIYAFTTLPFAEAYALIFLSPSIATILSIFILNEQVGWRRWLAVALGFAGVLAIVRPGFETLHLGHLAAFAVSFCAASTIIILRTLGQTERRVSLLAAVVLTSLLLNGTLMLRDFHWPAIMDLPYLLAAGVFAGIAQLCLILATRAAPANQVAPAQYSQMIWALMIGAIFFTEFPDLPAAIGIGLIAISGLFTFLREETKGRWWSRIILQRDRV
ncbi:MAG TPA: DMT family transporter [Dongiaceae bacterium]|jgi:drug/metabolite transporter (DMT)-like permease